LARRLFLEQLEDRFVPSLANGTVLVATGPSPFSNADQSSFPIGIVAVDPNTGAQAPVSTGGLFSLPTYIWEAPNQQLYVSDLTAFGTGALFAVDAATGQQRVVAQGGNFNGPNVFVFINGWIYVANEGDGYGTIHNIVRIDPSTGQQTLITNGGGFTVPTGMAPAAGNNVYVADEPGGYLSQDPGGVWEVNLDTGNQTQIAHGGLIDHPVDVTVDAAGNLLVVNTGSPANHVSGSIVRVDPVTGAQTLITSFGPYSGTDSGSLSGDGSTIFVGAISNGDTPGQIIAVDAATGTQNTVCAGGILSQVEGIRVFSAPVQAASTTTLVLSSANPVSFGQSVVFTAVISPQDQSTGAPTGTVQFLIDGHGVGLPVNVVAYGGVSTATFSTTTLTAGIHTITASYSGDGVFNGSTGTLSGGQLVNSSAGGNVIVTLDSATGLLRITGDAGNNAITVTQVAAGVYQVTGVGTTVNQSSDPATFRLVTSITVSFLNGDDSVMLSNLAILGAISIMAGSGSDLIALDTLTADSVSITTAGSNKDAITLTNTTAGATTISTGDNANVSIGGASGGWMKLTAGNNATLNVVGVTISGDLGITLGDNAQSVTVKATSVSSLNLMQNGGGNVYFDLENDTINNTFNLVAGDGNNNVVLSRLSVGVTLIVTLGTGKNTVRADHVTSLYGFVDGGLGGSNTYVDGGGNAGFFVFHFGGH
jgi:hypothetical protein